MGRCWGYKSHFRRITTHPNEFTPQLVVEDWFQQVDLKGGQPEVTFRLDPVPPLCVQVRDRNGAAVEAAIKIKRKGWKYRMPTMYSDSQGRLEIPIRPLLFRLEIEATTAEGLYGKVEDLQLTKQLDRQTPDVEIVVRPPDNEGEP